MNLLKMILAFAVVSACFSFNPVETEAQTTVYRVAPFRTLRARFQERRAARRQALCSTSFDEWSASNLGFATTVRATTHCVHCPTYGAQAAANGGFVRVLATDSVQLSGGVFFTESARPFTPVRDTIRAIRRVPRTITRTRCVNGVCYPYTETIWVEEVVEEPAPADSSSASELSTDSLALNDTLNKGWL